MVCSNNASAIQLKSFASPNNIKPNLEDLANGYNLVSSYTTESNAVVCEFNRDLSVPSGSENLMLDLNSPVHVLYAAGKFISDVGYHFKDRFITPDKVDFKIPIGTPVRSSYHFIVYTFYFLFSDKILLLKMFSLLSLLHETMIVLDILSMLELSLTFHLLYIYLGCIYN